MRDPRWAAGGDRSRPADPRPGPRPGRLDRDLPLGERIGSPHREKAFGYHPLFCFLDNTREALSGLLREGRAGSKTAADHITVLDAALQQIPDAHRYRTEILIRSDSAGCGQAFLAHIRSLRGHGINTVFSVGVAITEPIREAIRAATG